MTRKQRRFTLIGAGVGIFALAVGLVLYALTDSIVFFNSPTDLAQKHPAPGTRIRLGGLVVPGSIKKSENLNVRFEVTDGNNAIGGTPPLGCHVRRAAIRNSTQRVLQRRLPQRQSVRPNLLTGYEVSC